MPAVMERALYVVLTSPERTRKCVPGHLPAAYEFAEAGNDEAQLWRVSAYQLKSSCLTNNAAPDKVVQLSFMSIHFSSRRIHVYMSALPAVISAP